jgi:uncharacterized protein YndB with AHSA1/START domain
MPDHSQTPQQSPSQSPSQSTSQSTSTEAGDDGRVIDLSVEVPGTPEEVWAAIATGPGISSWFVPHQVDEHEGGRVRMDFGGGLLDAAAVAAWQPPRRLLLQGEGERALAYEWLVEARDGGTCVVRLVNSGFGPGEDWDGEFHGLSEGWRLFLENLRLHLTHFPGQVARAVIPSAMLPGTVDDAFGRACAALGVSPDLRPGDRFEASADGAPRLGGQVASVASTAGVRAAFLVLDAPAPGTGFLAAEGSGDAAAVSLWLYLYGDRARDLPDEWSPFLAALGAEAAPTA